MDKQLKRPKQSVAMKAVWAKRSAEEKTALGRRAYENSVSHKNCDHPDTPNERAKCRRRRQALGLIADEDVTSHKNCDHPGTQGERRKCRRRRAREAAQDGDKG